MTDSKVATAARRPEPPPAAQRARRLRALRLNSAGILVAAGRALTSQPIALALHTGLGLLMLVAGVTVLVRAIRARHRLAIAASALGFAAIIGAAVSGATFVSSDQDSASLAMGLLTGVALFCYLANLLTVVPSAKALEG
jgi:hypothetical protein